jgi:hypothetical protein
VRTGIDALVRQMHSHYSGPLLVDDPTTAEVRISPLLVDRMSRPAKPPAEIPPELRPRPELRQVTRGILAARPWCDHVFRQALCSGDAEQVTQRFTDEVRRALSASDAYAAHILCRRNITLPSQLVAAITMLTLPTPTRHTEVAQYAYVHPLGAPYAASCRVFIVERGCDAARDPLRAWAFAELVPQDSSTSRYVLWHMFDVEPSLDQVIELIRIRLDREGLPPIEAASPG